MLLVTLDDWRILFILYQIIATFEPILRQNVIFVEVHSTYDFLQLILYNISVKHLVPKLCQIFEPLILRKSVNRYFWPSRYSCVYGYEKRMENNNEKIIQDSVNDKEALIGLKLNCVSYPVLQ